MDIEFVKKRLDEINSDVDIFVLKGFPVEILGALGDPYLLLDKIIYQNDKIDLDKINCHQLLLDILQIQNKKAIISYESFIALTTSMRNISILEKSFLVLENNLLGKYINPTNIDIPDFDSKEFQDMDKNESYSLYYSYCVHIKDCQYVQYIEVILDNENNVSTALFIDPIDIELKQYKENDCIQVLSEEDGSLDYILEKLFFDMKLPSNIFLVDRNESRNKKYGVLTHACEMMHISLTMFVAYNNIRVNIRSELFECLKKTWNYDSFRNLKIYKDLNIDKTWTDISQGEIIETVIEQAEHAINDPDFIEMRNVLLTAPTGAGKSLLFQLAAIYLAQKYARLTIIISPLVALMNDQVDNLIGNYQAVASLNGNKTASEKESIIQGVVNGDIHILYMAPELLLSYSLSSFIGDRKIGLLVVDEAHTVTTWGRDFRVDYWFLGSYLRLSKRYLNYKFPIFALTATAVWDPSGNNDMVFDTIRSLNMDPCIKYIGVVRRDNIIFDIENPQITTNYEQNRMALTIRRIIESINNGKKTIVYFPFKKTIFTVLVNDEMQRYKNLVTEYSSVLTAAEKKQNSLDFKNGIKPVMCATKAYGMGIDVTDIEMVYHHAPTGCLSDYVQEIGRLARKPVITGVAKIDFTTKDFKYTRMLHGLSAIKPYQLRAVLKKLMALYKIKGEKRNMLISASDFEYIFPGKNVDYDQKVKSCLLLIGNDLLNKLRFQAIIVRPKNLFSKCYIRVNDDKGDLFYQKYHNFLTSVDQQSNLFILDAESYWNRYCRNLSFPNFKRMMFEGKIYNDFSISIMNRVDLCINENTIKDVRYKLEDFFNLSHQFLDYMAITHHRLPFEEMKKQMPANYSDLQREIFLESFKLIYASEHGLGAEDAAICKIYNTSEREIESFQLVSHGYEVVKNLYLKAFDNYITSTNISEYCLPTSKLVKLSELLNSLGLSDYQRLGGDNPSIFVRINNPNCLNDLVRTGTYDNNILNNIYRKYKYSEKIFTYFFTQKMSDKVRWDFIEDYFLGASESILLNYAKNHNI